LPSIFTRPGLICSINKSPCRYQSFPVKRSKRECSGTLIPGPDQYDSFDSFHQTDKARCTADLIKWIKRAPRPAFSAGIFFAIAFVMNNSGMQNLETGWKIVEPTANMIWILSQGSAMAFGTLYPFISGYLGLFGGFLSGSEASTIAMFTKYT